VRLVSGGGRSVIGGLARRRRRRAADVDRPVEHAARGKHLSLSLASLSLLSFSLLPRWEEVLPGVRAEEERGRGGERGERRGRSFREM